MRTFKHAAALLALTLCIGSAPAQQRVEQVQQGGQVVQDGIVVQPLSRTRSLAKRLISPEQVEQQASQQYVAMLSQAKEQGALYPATHPQVNRLRNIARRIIPHSTRWNADAQNWKWQVNLFNSDQVNAFCLPGGRIGFYSGIISKLHLTDDEIAAIMGHEVAHALREHGRERAGKAAATGLLARLGGAAASVLLGVDPNITGGFANAAGQLAVLKFSRDEEREADLIGLDIAARAGYDPRAGIALWRKMASLDERGAPIQLLSTHPGGEDRIAIIQDHMNVLLPVYARAKGTTVARLPAYRTTAIR
ncbi:M48 family metallopeptidase [Pseudoduganella sp. GCM10020061]|uniref:M48 family metallopeptidase n=1 Tax=Pseudoduganella sp. GCM10020061 TaxID=3317345 RepID=UPI0036392767